MKGRTNALWTPGDAPAFPAARALPNDGKQSVVRSDEVAALDLRHDGVAPAADAWIYYSEEDSISRIFGCERSEQMRRRRDAEGRRIVQRIDNG